MKTAMISDRNLPTPAPLTLRTVYTCEQFATEILAGLRSDRWVSDQCRARKIKSFGGGSGAPYMIPGSEARRFTGI